MPPSGSQTGQISLLTFVQSPDDLRLVTRWVRHPPYRKWLGAVVFFVLSLLYYGFHFHDPLLGGVLVGINILITVPLMVLRERREARRDVDKILTDDPTRTGQRTSSLGPQGLNWSSPTQETTFPWRGFQSIRHTTHFLILLMHDGQFIPIPRRVFAGRAEADQFRVTIAAFKKAADAEAPMPTVSEEQVWPPPPQVRWP